MINKHQLSIVENHNINIYILHASIVFSVENK